MFLVLELPFEDKEQRSWGCFFTGTFLSLSTSYTFANVTNSKHVSSVLSCFVVVAPPFKSITNSDSWSSSGGFG